MGTRVIIRTLKVTDLFLQKACSQEDNRLGPSSVQCRAHGEERGSVTALEKVRSLAMIGLPML